jgi:hypothetical protein
MARERPVILDDDEPPARARADAPARESARHGFEWGLASVIVGATFLIMAPPALLFCLTLWGRGNPEHGLSLGDLKLAEVGGIVCVLGAELLCLTGLLFGIRGLGRARRERQPAALPFTGILMCAAAMVAWLIVAIDLIMILSTFIRWREYGGW